jgi:hypothetical protein
VGKSLSNHIQVSEGLGVPAKQRIGTADETHTHTDADASSLDASGRDKDNTKTHPVGEVDGETGTLVKIFESVAPSVDQDPYPALRSYSGPLSAARLALLMFWAFRVSEYWSVEENWQILDMENFLAASRTLDKQFTPDKWRQHDSLTKRFPTAQSVLDKLRPPVPDPNVCSDGGEHEWEDYRHTTQQCSVCGLFRTNPKVTSWTAADELESSIEQDEEEE